MVALNDIQKELLPKLAPANIDPSSFLATDYLNHFNELLMMLEMLPDMPDMLEDLEDWAPKSYVEHFRDSGFTNKELAIKAYENAPTVFKEPFDITVKSLDRLIVSTLNGLKAVGIAERGISVPARLLLESRIETIKALLGQMNAIIHGNQIEEKQSTKGTIEPAVADSDVQSQDDIDKLFD